MSERATSPTSHKMSTPITLMLYGTTMLAVQGLEQAVSWLYAVANTDPDHKSGASQQRQVRDATSRLWTAFQRGSAGMRLKDQQTGLKPHLPPALFAELDRFIKGPRNELAHRFLIERIEGDPQDPLGRFKPATDLELLRVGLEAHQLTRQLYARADEIRATWPVQPPPPPEVKEFFEITGRMVMRKEFPKELVDRFKTDWDGPGSDVGGT